MHINLTKVIFIGINYNQHDIVMRTLTWKNIKNHSMFKLSEFNNQAHSYNTYLLYSDMFHHNLSLILWYVCDSISDIANSMLESLIFL